MPYVPASIIDTSAHMQREMVDRIVGSLRNIGGFEIRCVVTDLSPQTQERILRLGFEGFATELVDELYRPGWRAAPCGLVAVPKAKGGHRFLTPPADRDRLWSWALYDSFLYPRVAPHLSPCSFGFVRGRSNQGAVRALEDAVRTRPDGVLMTADVRRCFASLPVDGLLGCLWPVVNDPMAMYLTESAFMSRPRHPRINKVRRELVQAGTATKADLAYLDALHQTRRGIPEGSALSAVACVLYLRPLIDSLVAALPGAAVVHFGDNVAIWLRHGQERIAESVLQYQSKPLGVEIEVESVVKPPCQGSSEFLGIELVWSGSEVRLRVPDRVVVEIAEAVRNLREFVEQEIAAEVTDNRRESNTRSNGNVVDAFARFVWPRMAYYRDTDIGPLRHALWDAMVEWDEADRYTVMGLAARGWVVSRGRWNRYVDGNVLEADVRAWECRMEVDLGGTWSNSRDRNRARNEDIIEEMLTGMCGRVRAGTAQGADAQSGSWGGWKDAAGAQLRQSLCSLPLAAPASSAQHGVGPARTDNAGPSP